MSFVNPFDQKLGSDDSASIEYFSGNPNPQTLEQPELVVAFKNLLRKDQTTREKSSATLLSILPQLEIDDSLHLAWVQIYAKLCFDISPTVRTQSHQILGLIYQKLGKKCTKYLKDSISCWLCGFYDPVQTVSTAATQAFDLVFDTEERRQLVVGKFMPEIKSFCENVVLNQSPQTLSDERYVPKEESTLKYDRVLKQAIDVTNNVVLKHGESFQLLNNPKFWKLAGSSSSIVARAVLNVAASSIDDLQDPQMVFKQLIKAMKNCNTGSSTELIRALLIITKSQPELWDQSADDALVGYLKSASPFPQNFWPLFFNLALLTPITKPLLNALASLAAKAIGPTQTDIWGCFLTLCSRTKSVESPSLIAVKALAQRSERDISDEIVKSIASRFKIFEKSQVGPTVAKYLRTFNFARIMAATGVYTTEISEDLSGFTLQQLAELVQLDNNLQVTIDRDCVDATEKDLTSMLQIAVDSSSPTVDAQTIALFVLDRNPDIVLAFSKQLTNKGVKLSDLSTKLNLTDASTLKKAVAAHGGLVDDQSAKNYVWSLATSAIEGNEHSHASWTYLSDLASSDPQFIQRTLKETELASRLLHQLYIKNTPELSPLFNSLKQEDSSESLVQEILQGGISDLDVLVERAVNLSSTSSIEKLLLLEHEWLPECWPSINASIKYPVRYAIGEEAEPEVIDRVLKVAVYLINLIHRAGEVFDSLPVSQRSRVTAQIAICSCFCTGYEYSSDSENKQLAELLRLESDTLTESLHPDVLWQFVDGNSNKNTLPSHAYFAAQILYSRYEPGKNHELCTKYRSNLSSHNICAALLAQLHAGVGLHWYDRAQRQEYESINRGNDVTVEGFSCIDAEVDEEKYRELLLELSEQAAEPLLQEVLISSQTFKQSKLTEEVMERVLEYGLPTSKLLVMRTLVPGQLDRDVVRAASRLEDIDSQQNTELVDAFLGHCTAFLDQDLGMTLEKTSSNAQISWVFYCCNRGRAIVRYRDQLESSGFENTNIDLKFESYPDWLLYLDLVEEFTRASARTGKKSAASTTVFAENSGTNTEILGYVSSILKSKGINVSPGLEIDEIGQVVGNTAASALALLYRMSTLLGSSVREWYRDNKDRSLQLVIDQCLRDYIVPATMRSLSQRVQALRQDGVLESTTISKRAREFRAHTEIDETVAEIVITLDPLFPAKNAQVQLNGLDGVPEHKKRGWIIEAEYTVQNGLIIEAMRTLILKVNNFLEGVEPCAICYSVMEGKNLPSKTCTTCKNKYHTECLYKWFSSNKGEKNCPMCRSKMH